MEEGKGQNQNGCQKQMPSIFSSYSSTIHATENQCVLQIKKYAVSCELQNVKLCNHWFK